MSEPEQDGLTIAEAAKELGIVERRLRRLIARPEFITRTVTATRHTQSGMRTATILPSALLKEIALSLQEDHSGKNADSIDVDTDTAVVRQTRQTTRQAGGGLSLSAKNELLQTALIEREQRIDRQESEIEFLRDEVRRLTETVQALAQSAQERTSVALATETTEHAKSAGVPTRRWWEFWKA